MIGGAVLLALASIAVVTTLQQRANSSRDAQVTLGKVARDVDAVQSTPFDADGQGDGAQAAVREQMRASDQRIERRLAQLRRDHPSSHLVPALAPYRANAATLELIRRHVVRDEDAEADALGPLSGRLQRAVGRELGRAGVDYERDASKALALATFGSAAMILALVSLFGVFYLRSRKAHATAETLAEQNARLLVEDSQLQVIQRLALAAEYRDDDTGQHTRRVGEMSARIGEVLDMPADQLVLLRQAAPLHDVGKIGIPDCILLKPGRLTPDEFEQMKAHTTLGAAMLAGRKFPLLEMAEQIALSHHERWDGTGYPAGLSGHAIPLVGRVVAIADVFDALTHVRPYKEAWTLVQAVTEIRGQAGRQFDPEVVDAFLHVLPELAASEGDMDSDVPSLGVATTGRPASQGRWHPPAPSPALKPMI
ncbi:MAG TPA: HD domain-containing phosphohydrolase [Solirubrobacteraceae bacterium]|nr:HD domain-containing phosphohydrolase [Solirubrobacteraceae bacterium]